MKRIKVGFFTLLISLIPLSMISGQEKKSEQKVKIVVADDSGTRVVIDTVFTDVPVVDSIRLKDGYVIYLGKSRGEGRYIHRPGRERVFITVPSTDKGINKETKEITIISSDSIEWIENQKGEKEKIIIYSDKRTHGGEPGKEYKVITRVDKDGENESEQYIYINDDKVIRREGENKFDVYTIPGEFDSSVDKTKYVIAKNGIVVSVEGDDEEKVKEIMKEIESKLGVNKDESKNETVVKEVDKKTVKKK